MWELHMLLTVFHAVFSHARLPAAELCLYSWSAADLTRLGYVLSYANRCVTSVNRGNLPRSESNQICGWRSIKTTPDLTGC